jgi:protein-S-isoprenylcysteine O-methyltransferase Ste14
VNETRRPAWWRGERGEWYVVVQFVLFVLIGVGPRTLPGLPPWPAEVTLPARILGTALMIAGAALAPWGLAALGGNLSVLPAPKDCAELVSRGPYRIVRNPIYSGLILGAFGWGLWLASWLTLAYAVALFVLFDAKSRIEERWLAEKFGEAYTRYQRSGVRKLIPWVY